MMLALSKIIITKNKTLQQLWFSLDISFNIVIDSQSHQSNSPSFQSSVKDSDLDCYVGQVIPSGLPSDLVAFRMVSRGGLVAFRMVCQKVW